MSDSFGEGQPTPANDGWQGLRLGQAEPAKPGVVATPPAMAKGGVSNSPKSIPYARRAYPVGPNVRPGVLTALGVISIIVGAIALLVNCGLMAIWGYGYLMASDRQTRAAVAAASPDVPPPPAVIAPTPANLTAYTGDCVAADGLPRAARRAVIDTVRAKGVALSLDRAAMLDRLLAETGASAFGADSTLAQEIRVEAGGKVEGSPLARITTAQGLVELEDNTAAFTPVGAGKASVRINRNIVVTPESKRYSAVAMAEALEAARKAAGGKLNALQGALVLDELRRASVREWPDGRFEPMPISEVSAGRNGTVGLTVGDRSIWIFADGRTVDRRANLCEPDPVTGEPITTPMPVTTRAPRISAAAAGPAIGTASVALVGLIDAVIGLALAVLVLSAGIRLLNNSPRALSHHALYAMLKVALFAATVLLWNVGINSLVAPFGRGIASKAFQTQRQIGMVLGMVAQVAYPIAIMCVLSNGRIRRYARARGWDYGVVSPEPWARLRSAMDTAAGRRMLTIGGLGALAVTGLHAWCAYCAPLSARMPHLAALTGAGAVALGCLVRRITTTKSVLVVAALMITLGARGQSAEPATQPAAPRPKIILQLGKPVAKPLDMPAAATSAVVAPMAVSGGKEWFNELRSMPLNNRAKRLADIRDIDNLVVTEAARPAAIEAVPAITEVLLSPFYSGHSRAAMTLLEKIGPCEPVELACVGVMATLALEELRPRAVALALAWDPTGKSTAAKLRPYLLSGHGMVYVQRSAARSMARLGDAGVAELNALVYGRDDSVRQMAVAALADSAPVEKRLTMTARLLDDASPEARKDAVSALLAMGPAGRDLLIGRIFDRPECLVALQRTPGGGFRAIWSSMHLVTAPLRFDQQGKDAVITVIRSTEAGRLAAADRALVSCVESNVPELRQWAAAVIADGGFMRRAGPVTQEGVNALMGQMRSASGARTPLVAAPSAPADAAAWVMPAEGSLSAMAAHGKSEPPSELAWWVTGGFVVVMTYCLKRLAGRNPAGVDQDDEERGDDGDSREAPGMAA
ncbi:MAG: hypothetical protein JWN40_3799 [Phycisphaerales bacterium]|nr:hypothetical protein [Phycisphaerales bacterium]